MDRRDIYPPRAVSPLAEARLTPAWRAALEAGVDMSLVERSLAKTPSERIREHDRALVFMQRLAAGVRVKK